MRERPCLVRHDGETEALGQPRLQLREPLTEDLAVEGDRLNAATVVVTALGVGVIVAVPRAIDEPDASALQERDHLGTRPEEGVAPLEGGAGSDIAHHSFEMGHGVLVGVGDAVGLHDRVVRDPGDAAGHAGRAPDALLLLEHEGTRPGVVSGQCGHQAAAARSDDHEVDGGVPRGHVSLPDLPTACSASKEQASRIR